MMDIIITIIIIIIIIIIIAPDPPGRRCGCRPARISARASALPKAHNTHKLSVVLRESAACCSVVALNQGKSQLYAPSPSGKISRMSSSRISCFRDRYGHCR
jgi:hypothetical protein